MNGKIARRRFLQGASALALGTVSGCAGPVLRAALAAPSTPRAGGWLKVSVSMRPNTLNPLKHVNSAEYMLGELMYSGLTRIGAKMEPVPDLAVSWTHNADLTEWTFRLRPGVKFHNGDPLTPKDVAATFKAILDPAVASPGQKNVGPIASVAEKGNDSVVFKLTEPFADLPTSVAYTNAKIVPASALDRMDDLATKDFGTGPFKLVTFTPGATVRVERNAVYFMPGRPYLDGVIQAVYPDSVTEVGALLNGDTDLDTLVDPSQFSRLKGAAGVESMRTSSGQYLNMVLGCDTRPFSDVRVRMALALAIDRTQLLQIVLQGLGTPAYDDPISHAYRFSIQVPERKRDIAKARHLMAEAGYPNGVDLVLHAAESPASRAILAVAVKEMAAPAGFRIKVQRDAYDFYLAQVWKKANFYVGLYNMQPTIDSLFYLLYTSNAAWNETRWDNAEFDNLAMAGRRTINEKARAAAYAKAQMLIYHEVPAIVPFFQDLLGGRRSYVKNFYLNPRGAVFWLDTVWLTADAPKRS